MYSFAAALIALLRVGTHVVYGFLALGLIISGARALMVIPGHTCETKRMPSLSRGAVFLTGLTSSVMLSPCCTPIAIGLGLQGVQHGGAVAAALLLAFGLGHTLPLSIFAVLASLKVLRRFSMPHDACATVSGSLLMMVGGLYAILA
jgi:cytochrome c biogenesis protein CcdA